MIKIKDTLLEVLLIIYHSIATNRLTFTIRVFDFIDVICVYLGN